jgi:hypothetical protein
MPNPPGIHLESLEQIHALDGRGYSQRQLRLLRRPNHSAGSLRQRKGLAGVIDFIRQRNPQTPNVKASDFMDNRFIKELDDSGFIRALYR